MSLNKGEKEQKSEQYAFYQTGIRSDQRYATLSCLQEPLALQQYRQDDSCFLCPIFSRSVCILGFLAFQPLMPKRLISCYQKLVHCEQQSVTAPVIATTQTDRSRPRFFTFVTNM